MATRCIDSTFLTLLVRSRPEALEQASDWARRGDTQVTTEVNFYEVSLGIELERDSRRRSALRDGFQRLMTSLSILPLTREATELAVATQARLHREGKPAPFADLFIAAIAATGGCDLIVTKNLGDFERIDLLPVQPH